jgi:hypothetical protein
VIKNRVSTYMVEELIVKPCAVIFYTGLLLLCFWQRTEAIDYKLDNSGVGYDHIDERLLTEEVISSEAFRSYLEKKGASNSRPTHPMLIVTLKSGLKGLFKKSTSKNYHYPEVAAYRISKALRLYLVPPTVYRIIDGVEGSFQVYLQAPDLKNRALKEKIFETLDPKVKCDSKILSYLLGRLDVHGGNQLAVADGDKYSLFLIDNATTRHLSYLKYGGPAFLRKGENFDEPTPSGSDFPYDKVQTISGAEGKSLFKLYMNKHRANKFSRKEKVSYVIWDHGFYVKATTYAAGRFSKKIYHSTLTALKNLTYEMLFDAWREYYQKFPENAAALIRLTLDRRDQVVTFFERPGALVYNDE